MFCLTRQERQVILFLTGAALLGAGVSFTAKQFLPQAGVSGLTQDIGKIDINKADKEALLSIPGIGEKLAQRIIVYRRQEGGFRGIEELKNIKGMNNYRYDKLKGLLCVK